MCRAASPLSCLRARLPQVVGASCCCLHRIVCPHTNCRPTHLNPQFFRWAIYLYGLIVLLQVIIHVASPDYRWATFPSE